jgi:hypothetical protein
VADAAVLRWEQEHQFRYLRFVNRFPPFNCHFCQSLTQEITPSLGLVPSSSNASSVGARGKCSRKKARS